MTKLPAVTLGKRLRQAREKAGMTQAGLAHAVGYKDRMAVSGWESDTQAPPLATVEALAAALQCDPCWLAFGEGSELPTVNRPRASEA